MTQPEKQAKPEFQNARLVVEVQAGVVPGHAEPQYSRWYVLTSQQWERAGVDGTTGEVLAELNGKAQGYAALLMLQPDRLNWVRTDWMWM